MPHIVITGATSGIGRASVAAFLASGWRVTACGRDPVALAALALPVGAGGSLEVLAFDLTVPGDVSTATQVIRTDLPPVDVLFNCAGVQPWSLRRTAGGVEIGLATNVLAPIQLAVELAPAFVREPSALVLNMGSVVHAWAKLDARDINHDRRPFDPNAAYYETKLALMLVSQSMARRLLSHGVTVWSMEPGMTRTSFAREFKGFYRMMAVLWQPFMRRPDEVATEVVAIACDRPTRARGHQYWRKGHTIALAPVAQDVDLQEAVLARCLSMLPGSPFVDAFRSMNLGLPN